MSVKFRDFLKSEGIRIQMSASSKKDVIEKLVEVLVSSHNLVQRDEILTAVLEREALMSTGVGKSVAIPHGKVECVKDVTGCLAILNPGIDFGAPDEIPVRIVILLVASVKETGPHIRALAHISRVLQDGNVRDGLIQAKNAKEIMDVLERKEKEV